MTTSITINPSTQQFHDNYLAASSSTSFTFFGSHCLEIVLPAPQIPSTPSLFANRIIVKYMTSLVLQFKSCIELYLLLDWWMATCAIFLHIYNCDSCLPTKAEIIQINFKGRVSSVIPIAPNILSATEFEVYDKGIENLAGKSMDMPTKSL